MGHSQGALKMGGVETDFSLNNRLSVCLFVLGERGAWEDDGRHDPSTILSIQQIVI